MQNNRDLSIDYLRFIGISLIILAHISGINEFLFQLRCFDVPLMIFISGLTCSNKEIPSYKAFIIKRTKRLIIPVYVFLTLYFSVLLLATKVGLIPPFLSLQKIVETYLLMDGIGFVWIIRVFLLIMLITPLLSKINRLVENKWFFLFILGSIICVQEILIIFSTYFSELSFIYTLYTEYFLYIIGYSSLFLLGMKLKCTFDKEKYFWGVTLSFILCVTCCFYIYQRGLPILINNFKYPPHAYFIIYGATVSTILFILIKSLFKYFTLPNVIRRFVLFVGQNTIWIYLWHIPFVPFSSMVTNNCFLKYVIVYFCPLLIFTFQKKVIVERHNLRFSKYLVG